MHLKVSLLKKHKLEHRWEELILVQGVYKCQYKGTKADVQKRK